MLSLRRDARERLTHILGATIFAFLDCVIQAAQHGDESSHDHWYHFDDLLILDMPKDGKVHVPMVEWNRFLALDRFLGRFFKAEGSFHDSVEELFCPEIILENFERFGVRPLDVRVAVELEPGAKVSVFRRRVV